MRECGPLYTRSARVVSPSSERLRFVSVFCVHRRTPHPHRWFGCDLQHRLDSLDAVTGRARPDGRASVLDDDVAARTDQETGKSGWPAGDEIDQEGQARMREVGDTPMRNGSGFIEESRDTPRAARPGDRPGDRT